MKRLSPQQIQNILFTVLVVLAALAVYLLAGNSAKHEAEAGAAPTPAITEAPARKPGFEPVPGSIFAFQMTNSEDFLAKADKDAPTTLHMQCGGAKTGRATLSYTLDEDDCVSSFTILFPMADKPATRPITEYELQYAVQYETFAASQSIAIQTILYAAVAACDLNSVLIGPVALQWYAGALEARDDETNYENAYGGCTFQAYPVKRGTSKVLVCSLMIGE